MMVTNCLNGTAPVLSFDLLNKFPVVQHLITTRMGGVSQGKYESLNLSNKVGDRVEYVSANRQKVADLFNIPADKLIFPDQCHTNRVKKITEIPDRNYLEETDALVTGIPGYCLCILTADCVPLFLFDSRKTIVAAIHAGWRGTVNGIVPNTIQYMQDRYQSHPEDIIACIGPCVSAPNYEVQEDVSRIFARQFENDPDIIIRNKNTGNHHIDLRQANHFLLLKSGIKKQNIGISKECTFARPELFYSARRDGIHCGRFASCIMINRTG